LHPQTQRVKDKNEERSAQCTYDASSLNFLKDRKILMCSSSNAKSGQRGRPGKAMEQLLTNRFGKNREIRSVKDEDKKSCQTWIPERRETKEEARSSSRTMSEYVFGLTDFPHR
jgi:hypothetical protein